MKLRRETFCDVFWSKNEETNIWRLNLVKIKIKSKLFYDLISFWLKEDHEQLC